MDDIDAMRKEVHVYIDNASAMDVLLLHRYALKLETKSTYEPKFKPTRAPRIPIIKDWWNALSEQQVVAINKAIMELDKEKGINDLKVKKQHPTWFQ